MFIGLHLTVFSEPTLGMSEVKFSIGSKQYEVDGNRYNMDVTPYIKDERTFLPVRYVATALGIPESGIDWDNQQRQVRLVNSLKEVTLSIGTKEMLVKGSSDSSQKQITMDVMPEITDDRVMLPLRWIAEAFDIQVQWDPNTKTVLMVPAATGITDNQQLLAVVTGSVVNIRSGPSIQTDILSTVKQGTQLSVQGQSGDWYKVAYGSGKSGYIISTFVSIHSLSQPSRGGSTTDRNETSTSILKGKKIVIDPGHGGNDPGAIGVTGLKEKDFNLDTAQRVYQILNKLGAKPVITRTQDVLISLEDRPAVANKLGADVFVSIHANASPSPDLEGTITYYHLNSADSVMTALDKKNISLAKSVHQALIKNLNIIDKNTRPDPGKGFVVLRESMVPAILIETAFLSNKSDEALLKSDSFRQKVAEGIVSGLANYFTQP